LTMARMLGKGTQVEVITLPEKRSNAGKGPGSP